MKATSERKAFEKAFEILGAGVEKDEEATKRAGYAIYRSTANASEWVSDLGDRLEVNTANGESVVIWIEAEAETETASTEEKPLATVEKRLDDGDIITAEEYNAGMSALGWVVRCAFGRWCVCDGKAPDGVRVGRRDVFVGNVLKWCDTMQQADTLRDLLKG